jgi:hypothetical protein
MMQTLSTSPQNTNSIHRPAKAVLDAFTEADIAVEPILADVLTELATLRDLPATFPLGGEQAAKAGGEESDFARWSEVLAGIDRRVTAIRTKFNTPEDVSST